MPPEETPAGETPATPPTPETPKGPAPESPTQSPPWGDDFDAERAWKTITNLRDEVKDLKPFKAQAEELENANKTELERIQEANTSLNERASTAEKQLAQVKAAIDAGIPLEMASRLDGGTPEELAADAKAMADLLKPAKPASNGLTRGVVRDDGAPSSSANPDAWLRGQVRR